MKHLSKKVSLMLLLAGMLMPGPLWSQEFPSRPVRIVLAVPAGSQGDSIARVFSNKLKERFNWTAVIDPKPGGDFAVSILAVKQAAADGYTIIEAPGSFAVTGATKKNLPYDVLKDLAPLVKVVINPVVIAVNNDVPGKTLTELAAYSKANPGKLSYGVTGIGGVGHLVGELLRQTVGLDMVAIPYKGGPAMLAELMEGRIHVSHGTLLDYAELIKAGKIRGLIQIAPGYGRLIPNVPTGLEATGNSVLDSAASWYGFMAHANTPKPLLEKLEKSLTEVARLPDVQDQLRKLVLIPDVESSEEFGKRISTELTKWRGVVQRSSLQFE